MTGHSMAWIRRREDIGGGANWYEVGCSCGWFKKYPSEYRARGAHEGHAERISLMSDGSMVRTAT